MFHHSYIYIKFYIKNCGTSLTRFLIENRRQRNMFPRLQLTHQSTKKEFLETEELDWKHMMKVVRNYKSRRDNLANMFIPFQENY